MCRLSFRHGMTIDIFTTVPPISFNAACATLAGSSHSVGRKGPDARVPSEWLRTRRRRYDAHDTQAKCRRSARPGARLAHDLRQEFDLLEWRIVSPQYEDSFELHFCNARFRPIPP
jgi:hypothetical protein